ncbi:type I-E CRISPR-associated protein Cas5/CasD [Pseudoduganella namucuonensis]|uniref:CRISPR system Cascade subunit CasD n=1 Tax=Pseudoduganella namucuonensis TaxID=1035707 RepID=A0A1I7ETK7_9BURK|nr:type I-E CRISPR-associated protein Cas5/CasD [Pseudoduganella namucuonensis]SFU27265.1 CRISPR system Cascade subunit CasD [Pseudoduganella namucuonensis]
METLVFQLYAPLASWGDMAVGEYRPTAEYPSRSALLGLLGAALGIARADEHAQATVSAGYRFAIGVLNQGRLLRDYQTAQVPGRAELKKRAHATRRDELAFAKQDLNTILSSRDYRQDAACLVAVQAGPDAPYALTDLATALQRPKFVLYLGRKSCPPAAPLNPRIMTDELIGAAFAEYQSRLRQQWQQALPRRELPPPPGVQKLVWGDDFGDDDLATIGVARDLTITRKDQPIARQGWQFADRREHIALCVKG